MSTLGPLSRKEDENELANSKDHTIPKRVRTWLYWLETNTDEKEKADGLGEWNRMMLEIDAHTHANLSEDV